MKGCKLMLGIAPQPIGGLGFRTAVGIWMLEAYLKSKGIPVVTFDLTGFSEREICTLLEAERPDILGLRCLTYERFAVVAVLQVVKRVIPSARTLLGGPHATIMYRQLLANFQVIDGIVVGEGYAPLYEYVSAVREVNELSRIKGLAFRNEGKVVFGGARGPEVDLNQIPPFEQGYQIQKNPPSRSVIYINAATGCEHKCSFCSSNTIWGRRSGRASIRKTLDDIEFYVSKYGLRRIAFCDDTLNPNRQRVMQLCQGILDRRLEIKWSSAARVSPFDSTMARLMKRAGCVSLEFGVETGSDRLRKKMRKNTTKEQIFSAFRHARDAHIETLAFIMFGFPGETVSTIIQTLRMVARIRPSMVLVSFCGRLPGTEFEQTYKKTGKFRDDDYLVRDLSTLQLVKKFTAYGPFSFLLVAIPSILADFIARCLIARRSYSMHQVARSTQRERILTLLGMRSTSLDS